MLDTDGTSVRIVFDLYIFLHVSERVRKWAKGAVPPVVVDGSVAA